MSTNSLRAKVPCGAGRGFNSFTFTWSGDAVTELGRALNGAFSSYLSVEWTNDGGFPAHSSTPPTLPVAFSAPMWDAGTNSPDGQLPATVVVSNVRIQVNPGILTSGAASTTNLFTLRGRIVNGGDFYSAPLVISVDTHPGVVTFDYPLSPATGLPWTRAELFASDFGVIIDTVDSWAPGVNSTGLIYYPFPTLGFGSNSVFGFQVIVTYSSPSTYDVATSLDVTSALSLAGSGTAKGGGHEVSLDAEATIDSHLGSGLVIDVPTTNRWELQRFSVRPTKQGDR